MNRNQRRLGRMSPKRNGNQGLLKSFRAKDDDLEEVFPPKSKRYNFYVDKPMTSRCCYISPEQKDFGQMTEWDVSVDKYQNILREQYYGYNSGTQTNDELNELKRALSGIQKVENASQYIDTDFDLTKAELDVKWENVDNIDEIEKYAVNNKEVKNERQLSMPRRVHISEVPRIKIIAEKFSRFKKNNVELRKLDEKVVCVEYDIYDLDLPNNKPIQEMRAFFSVKPYYYEGPNNTKLDIEMPNMPSDVKAKLNIGDEDLNNMKEKEIEIIDGKISENKPYLDDLKRVLKRQKLINDKKNKNSLDLVSLYEIAKKETPVLDENFSHTNLLSKAELEEVKDLILKQSVSSVHGINRRVVKGRNEEMEGNISVISQSIINELLKEVDTF